jgi:nitrogen fixation protein FixH
MIKELTGKHVLVFFIVFFGIVFTASGFLVYYSQQSWTGLETRDAYQKGLKYNQQLSKSEAQNIRGWSMVLMHKKASDGDFTLSAIPKDQNGELLSGLKLTAELKRPTHEGIDRNFILKETDLGVYTGKTEQLPLGKWYLIVTADRGKDVLYRSKNELYLK